MGSEMCIRDRSKGDYKLGGSSFAQVLNKIGSSAPDVCEADYLKKCFDQIQKLIVDNHIIAGHDISAGGMATTLLELCFPSQNVGATIDLTALGEDDTTKLLMAENAGIIFQSNNNNVATLLSEQGITCVKIGTATNKAVSYTHLTLPTICSV